MKKNMIVITALCLCILPATQAQAKSNAKAGAPTIAVTKLEVTDKILTLRYEIKNGSGHDIWIRRIHMVSATRI